MCISLVLAIVKVSGKGMGMEVVAVLIGGLAGKSLKKNYIYEGHP